MEEDAKKCEFRLVKVYGRQGLFCDSRIERASVPKGWHMYEIQHQKTNRERPIKLGRMVMTEFYGTVLTPKAIRLPEGEWDYRDIQGNRDLHFLDGKKVTLKEYGKLRKKKRR